MITETEIEKKVIGIVSEQLARPTKDIIRESSFMDDLGGDSLDQVELMMQFEEEFELVIPDDESLEIQTIGEIVDYIRRKLAE